MSIQLAPEIEAGLRAEADALGTSVDALVASAVRRTSAREHARRLAGCLRATARRR